MDRLLDSSVRAAEELVAARSGSASPLLLDRSGDARHEALEALRQP